MWELPAKNPTKVQKAVSGGARWNVQKGLRKQTTTMDRASRREGAWDQAEKEDGAEKQKQQREGKTHGANGAFKLGAQKSKQMQTHPSIGENSNTLVTAGSLGGTWTFWKKFGVEHKPSTLKQEPQLTFTPSNPRASKLFLPTKCDGSTSQILLRKMNPNLRCNCDYKWCLLGP